MWPAGSVSFCAEANKLGINVTSFDPIYSLLLEKIIERSSRISNQFTGLLDLCRPIAGLLQKSRIHARIAANARPACF